MQRAKRDQFGNPIASELRLLVVHGTLHLLGYDHDSPAAKGAHVGCSERCPRRLSVTRSYLNVHMEPKSYGA